MLACVLATTHAAETMLQVEVDSGCHIELDLEEFKLPDEGQKMIKDMLFKAVDMYGGKMLKDSFDQIKAGIDIPPEIKKGLRLVCRGVDVYDRFFDESKGGPYSCWRKSQGRGLGRPATECKANEEKNGLLCYSKCMKGYYGVLDACWQLCPEGTLDNGSLCWKNRGSLDKCPIYMTEVLWGWCDKNKYHREGGSLPGCTDDEDYVLGICYKKCKHGKGVGPMCQGSCPPGTTECGLICLTDDMTCSEYAA